MGVGVKILLIVVVAWITYQLLQQEEVIYPELLHGKNVLLTGASSGIGEQMAYYLASVGANVVIAARREQLLKQVVQRCKQLSPDQSKFKYIVVDFSILTSSEKVIMDAVQFLGGLDILFLNHAYLLQNETEISKWKGTDQQYRILDRSLTINFLSFAKLTDYALPHLLKVNGAVGVTSSMILEVPRLSTPYAVSKSAINTFYTSIRQEMALDHQNVSFTVIHLGYIPTDSSHNSLDALVKQTRLSSELVDILKSTSVSDCGRDIVRAVARRETNFYYPPSQALWQARILRLLFRDADNVMDTLENIMLYFLKIKKYLFFL